MARISNNDFNMEESQYKKMMSEYNSYQRNREFQCKISPGMYKAPKKIVSTVFVHEAALKMQYKKNHWHEGDLMHCRCLFNAAVLKYNHFPEFKMRIGTRWFRNTNVCAHPITHKGSIGTGRQFAKGFLVTLDAHVWLQHDNGTIIDVFFDEATTFGGVSPAAEILRLAPKGKKKRKKYFKEYTNCAKFAEESSGNIFKMSTKMQQLVGLEYRQDNTDECNEWFRGFCDELGMPYQE